VLDTERFVISCRHVFAEAHGISEWEAMKLFRRYNIRRFLVDNERGLGHCPDFIVPSIRNIIIDQGGVLPDLC